MPKHEDLDLTDRKKLIKIIRKRKARLNKISKELKEHFVGLDQIIDKIISGISTWYQLPELQTRPTILCLFGPTGVGKTDLVRRLVKLLDFHDRFCEVELMNKGGNSASYQYHSSISSVLSANPKIESGKPSIILLDEIQNFRTLNEDGKELPEYKFRDIWMLLSDGKLPFHVDLDYIMQLLWEYNEAEKNPKKKKDHKMGTFSIRDFADSLKKKEENIPEETEDPKLIDEDEDDDEDDETEEIEDRDMFDRVNRNDYYSLNHFKTILRLDTPIEEIAKWSLAKKRSTVTERLNDPSLYEQADYTKCLIFISGNIDEAYRFAKKTDEVDVDADIFHKKSLKINILNIKKALMNRFRPEQIARFGNTQIIYPTLSKKSYQTIIQRKVKEIVRRVKEKFEVTMDVDESIHELIYKNGVFPTQGTRPLFTTITEILEGRLPQFLLKALVMAKNKIDVYYENDKICARVGNAKMANNIVGIDYKGSLDKLRSDKNKNLDERVLNAVHEAGHAVVYAHLLKIAPPQISAVTASQDIGGFIWTHEVSGSKKQLEDRICITMAGNIAERMVFGDDGATWALQEDIMEATNLAGSMVKKYGMDRFSTYRSFPQRTDIPNTDIESANPIMEEIMTKANERAKELVISNIPLFEEIVDYLMGHEQLESEEFKKICNKHGIKISVKNSEETIYTPFLAKYNSFKEKS